MTSSTIRIDPADKSRLRRLQEAWRRVRGEAPPLQGLLSEGLAYLERHQEGFLAEAVWRPLTPDELARLRARQGHYGAEASVQHIDDVVYGA